MQQQKLPLVLFAVGVFLVVLAVLVDNVGFPLLIDHKVSQTVRLEEGGDTFKKWQNIPIPILMKVYFFNVTNPEKILKGERPIVQEIGPYVYEQKRAKINITIKEMNDTIKYKQTKTYFFRRDLSVGDENDTLSFINVPHAGLVGKSSKMENMQKYLVKNELSIADPDVFIMTTVDKLLFAGTYVSYIEELSKLKGESLLPDNKFGFFYKKNGSASEWFEVYSGVKENSKFGNIAAWKEEPSLDFYEDDYCNMINGSDGALFPPFVTKDRRLNIFSTDLCRSLYLTYESETEIHGLTGYRFTLPPEVLEDPRINDDNKCFCTDKGDEELSNCPKRGGYQIESCKKGTPIVITLPHFLDADPEYRNNCLGLEPDREKHETVITLEPKTGVLLQAKKRIQINLHIKPTRSFKKFKRVPNVILPLLWQEEFAELTPESADRIRNKLIKPVEIVGTVCWAVVGVGCLFLLLAILIFVIRLRRRNYKV